MEVSVKNDLAIPIWYGTDISHSESGIIAPGAAIDVEDVVEVLFLKMPLSVQISEDGKRLDQNHQFIEIKNCDFWTHIIFFGKALPPEFRTESEDISGNEKKNVTVTGDENEG